MKTHRWEEMRIGMGQHVHLAQVEGPYTTKKLRNKRFGDKNGNSNVKLVSYQNIPPLSLVWLGAGMIPSDGERIHPLREMSLFGTRKESWNVKTFCKRVIPANDLFGGGGNVSLGVAGVTQTIELSLSFAIKHWFFTSLCFPENPPEHPGSRENCCASNGEVSPKRINFFRIFFWELKIFDGILYFPRIKKKEMTLCANCHL